MPHDRFFYDGPQDPVLLRGTELHHLTVLRKRVGEEIELVDGKGSVFRARLDRITTYEAHLVLVHRETAPPPFPQFFLGQSLLRMNHLEWAVEKSTELGADVIYLFPTIYSEKATLSPHQIERLHHIAIAALKQSGRLYLPELIQLPSLQEALKIQADLFFGDTSRSAPHLSRIPTASRLLFLAGPEKGFSQKELELLRAKAHGCKLNTNILRAETAPLAALSILSFLYRH